MPRVPTPALQGDQRLGAVQQVTDPQTPFQNLRAPDLTGSGRALVEAGRNISRAGDALSQIALDKRRLEDERNLLEIQTTFGKWRRDQLYAEGGILSRKNGNAVGLQQEYEQKSEQFLSQALAGRELSAAGLAAAQQWLGSQRTSFLERVGAHENEQLTNYNNQLQEANIENLVDEGSYFYRDPDKFALAESGIRQAAQDMAKRQGLDGQAAEEFIESRVAGLYTAAISRALVNGYPALAKTYLEQATVREYLTGDDLAKAEGAVRERTVKEEAFQVTQDIMTRFAGNEPGALSYIRENVTDPDVRERAVAEVTTRFQEQRRFREERLRNLRIEAVTLAREGRFDEIPDETLAEIGGEMTARLIKLDADARSGFATVTDFATYNRLNRMTDEQLLDVDLTSEEYVGKLSRSDAEKFSNLQGALQRGGADASDARSGLRTRAQIISGAAKALRLNDEQEYNLSRAVDDRLASMTPEERKSADIQDIVDDLIVEGTTASPDAWLQPTRPLFETPVSERGQFRVIDVEDIPAQDRDELALVLRDANGRVPTDEEMLAAYNRYLQAQLGAAGR